MAILIVAINDWAFADCLWTLWLSSSGSGDYHWLVYYIVMECGKSYSDQLYWVETWEDSGLDAENEEGSEWAL